jgi:hypothetical protein
MGSWIRVPLGGWMCVCVCSVFAPRVCRGHAIGRCCILEGGGEATDSVHSVRIHFCLTRSWTRMNSAQSKERVPRARIAQ